MFFTDRQDFSLPVGSYIFCSEAFAFESILSIDSNKTWPLPQYSKGYMMKVINDSLIRNLKKPGEAHSICELKTTFSFLVLTSLFICAIL